MPEKTAPVPATRTGPGRVLVAVYAVFAIAATSRATWQILTRFDEAPLAYLLSAVAGLVYLVAAVGLARSSRRSYHVAVVCCLVELVGVLAVGVASVLAPGAFPDDTVWSGFGSGYLYIPLVLPVLGLWWLRSSRTRAARGDAGTGTA